MQCPEQSCARRVLVGKPPLLHSAHESVPARQHAVHLDWMPGQLRPIVSVQGEAVVHAQARGSRGHEQHTSTGRPLCQHAILSPASWRHVPGQKACTLAWGNNLTGKPKMHCSLRGFGNASRMEMAWPGNRFCFYLTVPTCWKAFWSTLS